jgi:DNA polymerase III delta subunit
MARRAAAPAVEKPAAVGEGFPPPVAVLVGPERFLQLDYAARAREALQGRHGRVEVFRFDAETSRPADVLDECRSMGLLAAHKLVVVDNADAMLKDWREEGEPSRRGERSPRELFADYVRRPEPSATLLLRAPRLVMGKLEGALREGGGALVPCEEATPAAAAAWACQRAARHGVRLARPAGDRLVAALGCDLARLDSELARLAVMTAARGQGEITAELIDRETGVAREEEVWSIQAPLLSGDARAALEHLDGLLSVSRQAPAGLSWAFIDLARKLDGACRGQTAHLRLWGPSAAVIPAVARSLAPEQTAALLEAAVETDARLKSGRGEPRRLLERLTLRFTGLTGRRGAGR